jgi:predicted methyltransferase
MRTSPLVLLALFAPNVLAQCPCPCPSGMAQLIAGYNPRGFVLGNQNLAAEVAQRQAATENQKAQTELLRVQTENLRAERAKLETDNAAGQRAIREQQIASEAQARLVATFQLLITVARHKHPDFDAVVNRQDVTLTPAMVQALIESGSGAELMYYLGKHPEEAVRIAGLSPVSSILEIGKIAGRLSNSP